MFVVSCWGLKRPISTYTNNSLSAQHFNVGVILGVHT